MRKKHGLVLMAIGLLLLAACGGAEPGPADGLEDVAGTWERQADQEEHWRFMRLEENGTLSYGEYVDALDSGTEGTDLWMAEFWFEGTQFHTQDSTVGSCLSDVGIYDVTVLANGNLLFTPVEEGCRARTAILQGTKTSLDEDPYAEWAPVR